MRALVLLVLLILLAGCAAPELALEKLPAPVGPSGEVVIVRPSAFIEMALAGWKETAITYAAGTVFRPL